MKKLFEETPFTVEDGLRLQEKNLAEWKAKLTSECYEALVEYCKRATEAEGPHIDGYSIPRGNSLANFVHNWNP